MIPIPDSPDEVTADWLSAALRHGGAITGRVGAVEHSPLGEGIGLLSAMLRCRLRYRDPRESGPASVVVKLEPRAESFRAAVEGLNAFEREIRFYRELAAQAPLRVPRFYYGDWDQRRAVIVLEDLGHLTAGDQVRGLDNSETLAAVRRIARLHAAYWDNDKLAAIDWMPRHENRLTASFTELWDRFEAIHGARIGPDGIALGRRVRRSVDWLRQAMMAGPCTLCHGDFRADNLLFGAAGGPEEVVVIDWQVSTRSLPTVDLARLLGGSEQAAERRGHALEVFDAWHDALLDAGLRDYPRAQALRDFQLGALLTLFVPVRIFKIFGDDLQGRSGRLEEAIVSRVFASALELDAGKLLP